jgi:hypothetical protein
VRRETMNIKTKLKKALEEGMTEVQICDYELVNKRYLEPDEVEWRVRALSRAEGKVELICELLGIPNRLKPKTTVSSRPVMRFDPINLGSPLTDADLPF